MSTDNKLSEIYVSFIDLLFAVVLGQSFILISGEDMLPTWVADFLNSIPVIFNVLLVYALIITSWVGYHKSVIVLPIKSAYRFIVDVILLFLYYAAFRYVNSIESLTIIFSLIFCLYFVWNLIRYFIEYAQERSKWNLKKRMYHAFIFTLSFIGIACAVHFIPHYFIQSAAAIGILILLIIYRRLFWGGPNKGD